MKIGRTVAFSALVCPAGVHVVAYTRTRAGLQIQRYNREVRSGLTAEEAADVLARILESEGARGRRVSVAVTGFGTCHQILTLPPASREFLQPIVARELRRFYPDLFATEPLEPIIDFVELDSSEAPSPGPQKELLVAAVPQGFLRSVWESLAARGIRLEHWTIVPRSTQRLYDAFAGPETTAAALVMVPEWPLLGFFHQRELRLFSEPRSGPAAAAPESENDAVVEHLERGAIFLRQQFRGATVSQVYLAAEAGTHASGAAELIRERLGVSLEHLGPDGEAPGALAALGAALDAAATDGLNLLPADLRPPSRTDQWTHGLAVASAALVLLAALWWGWSGMRAESKANAEIEELREHLAARVSEIASVRPIIQERQAHAQRAAILDLLSHDRRRLPEILWPLQAAAGTVEIRRLEVTRQESGWQVVLGVRAVGMSSAEVTSALTALSHQLGAELPKDALSMSGLSLVPVISTDTLEERVGPMPIAASVDLSFIVPALKETVE